MQTARRAARLVVLDEREQVLLFQHGRPDGSRFWATPGASLRPGETYEDAASRCLLHELGVDADLQRAWAASTAFPSAGRLTFQEEQFFVVTVENFPVDDRVLNPEDNGDSVLGVRWWSRDEVQSPPLHEDLFPRDLATQLRVFGTGGSPMAGPGDIDFGTLFESLDDDLDISEQV